MSKNVLVIATHPDDETLGAGGTLLKHKAQNDTLHCIFCTDITTSGGFTLEAIQKREMEIAAVSAAYGFSSTHRLGLRTMCCDEYSRSEIIAALSKIFKDINPQILYLPFAYDVHSDHRVIFECAFACTKSFRYPSLERVLMMETVSETEFAPSFNAQSFVPNVFVDITPYFKQKCEIMSLYQSELGIAPFPRSLVNLEALAIYRGCTHGGITLQTNHQICGAATNRDFFAGGGAIDGIAQSTLYCESFMLLKEKC